MFQSYRHKNYLKLSASVLCNKSETKRHATQ